MNRKLLFIFLWIISQYLINCEDIDECNTGFEVSKKRECEQLIQSNDTYKCYYNMSIGECQTIYKECTAYEIKGTPTPNTNDYKTCSEIFLSGDDKQYKKCEIKEGTSSCSEVFRICSDYKAGQDICSALKVNIDDTTETPQKRCALNSDLKCGIHYNDCGDINDKQDCIKNIPLEAKNYCYWNDNPETGEKHCQIEDSGCSNYTMINTISPTPIACKDLKHGANTKCILDGETCKEDAQAGCESYDGNDEMTCKSYKPIDNNNKVLKLSMCDFDGNKETKCFTTPRLCPNFTSGSGYNCEELTTKDPLKKRCFLEGSTCTEVSIECNGFVNDDDKTEEQNKNVCESITPYKINTDNTISVNEHSKCKYNDDKTCTLVDKECTNLNNKDICNSHVFTDDRKSKKKCIYKGSQCKEVYKTCEVYDFTDNDVNDKANCEEIEETSQTHKCVYTSATTTPKASAKCETVERECSVGNGNKETCSSLKPTNDTIYCLYTDNNQCIEQYKTCNTTDDRILCESNIPEVQYIECILEKDSQCTPSIKKCSEYKGDNEEECKNYEAIDTTNNECVYVNNECIEQPKIFTFCSDYRGKDEKICESIKPLKPDETPYSPYTYSVKCQIKNNKCILIEPECSAITNKEECFATKLKDEEKICVFDNNKCKEQYKDCATFESHKGPDETVNKNTCESLIGKTCIYNTGTCQAATQECKHFNPDLYEIQKECTDTTLTDKTKKCVYKNGKCSKKTKTCIELSEFESQTLALSKEEKESACKNAESSEENKECTLKDDGTGCEEVNKSENGKDEDIKSPDTSKTDSNGDSNQDSGNEGNTSKLQHLNKLLIFIICLLF